MNDQKNEQASRPAFRVSSSETIAAGAKCTAQRCHATVGAQIGDAADAQGDVQRLTGIHGDAHPMTLADPRARRPAPRAFSRATPGTESKASLLRHLIEHQSNTLI